MIDIPPMLVLIVCKTLIAGPPDQNSEFTHWENREWATEHSKMVCRRHEIQMFDPEDGKQMTQGDTPAFPLRPNFFDYSQCARAGVRLSKEWDDDHQSSPWRVWRIGCPAPIIDTRTGAVIGYKLPDCGHRETVTCETDSAI